MELDEKTIAGLVSALSEEERWHVVAFIGRLKTGGSPFQVDEETSTETEAEIKSEKKRKRRQSDPTGLSPRVLKVMKTKIDGASPDEIYADFRIVNILRQSDSPEKIRALLRRNGRSYMSLGPDTDRWIYRHILKVKKPAA